MFEFLEMHVERSLPMQARINNKATVFPVNESEISVLMTRLPYEIPGQLLNFFREIGYGFFNRNSYIQLASPNRVCNPIDIAEIFNGNFEGISSDFQLEPDTLPFFECDLDLYLCLKPHSDNPNAVWWMWGELMPNGGKICDSLVEFFQKLIVDPNWFNPPKKMPE